VNQLLTDANMPSFFPIYRADPGTRLSNNTKNDSEGRFYKYWCVDAAPAIENIPLLGRCLFKAATPDDFTPAQRRLDWSEKVAAELGKLIGIPTAHTELAVGYATERQTYIDGTISVDYTPFGAQIISGRGFLSTVDPLFDVDQPGGLDPYNVENVLHHLHKNSVGLPLGYALPSGIDQGVELMVGYLLFDAWLSATDRHDENWEIAVSSNGYALCPTFDHGDSLGVKLSDRDRDSKNFADPALAESCWWENRMQDGRAESTEISSLRAFTIAAGLFPDAARIWQEELAQVTSAQIREIFEQIPDNRITLGASSFAISLLEFNHHQLIGLFESPRNRLSKKPRKSSFKQPRPPQQSM
jgi:hypothetical protein